MGTVVVEVVFALTWVLVAIETIVLVDVMRRAVRLKVEVYAAMPEVVKRDRLAAGTVVDFAARDVDTGSMVRSKDLRGAPAVLLFLKADGTHERILDWLLDTVAGLRHKGEGRVLMLCNGTAAACTQLSQALGHELPVLLDEGGKISGRFLVRTTPAAVLLDADAGVDRYGAPEHVPDGEEEAM